ncbi:MAG: deoxynucleoside kinase [Mangrovibacterium sp.]
MKHIAIAGNIGAGKTTLTELLAKHYNWIAEYEKVDDNPYLNDFYEDMRRWSFNLQVYFLTSRFQQILAIREAGKTVIQDRTIFEDAEIFAPNLQAMGLMPVRDYDNYRSIFNIMSQLVKAPDLIIYLKASIPTLVNHIQRRGRQYETSIRIDYLTQLNERYENWAKSYTAGKLIVIDIDKINITTSEGLNHVIDRIEAEIHSLFNE